MEKNVSETFWMLLKDVLTRTVELDDTPWRRLEDVLKAFLQDVLKTFWKRLEDVLKTYRQDEYIRLDQDVLKTSSEDVRLRRTNSSWSRRLKDVFIKTNVCWVYCCEKCKVIKYRKILRLKIIHHLGHAYQKLTAHWKTM